MEKQKIKNYEDLEMLIEQTRMSMYIQGNELKASLKDFIPLLHPISVGKKTIKELLVNTNMPSELSRIGLNIGSNLIIDTILGKNRSIRGFINSVIVENIASPIINRNVSEIKSGLNNLIIRIFKNK